MSASAELSEMLQPVLNSAYRQGWSAGLQAFLDELLRDQDAGVELTVQRVVAAAGACAKQGLAAVCEVE